MTSKWRSRTLAVLAGVVMAVAGLATGAGTASTLTAGCTTPDCIRGVPPMVVLAECSEPKCLSGTRPLVSLECSEPKCLGGTQPVRV